jgi:hypothetical protein
MATATLPAEQPQEPQQKISDFGRIGGVLFSPGATFADIAKKPSWIVPIVLLTIFSIAVVFFLNQKMDWPAYIRHQDEQTSRWQQLSDEQKDNAVAIGAKIAPAISWGIGALGVVLSAVIISFVYWLAFNVLSGAQLRYGQSMAIVSYAYVPAIISSILAMVVLAMKRFGDVDPQRMLATSVAAFLPSDAPKWEVSLGASIEIFWLWTMILMVIGYSKANPKKISSGSAFGIVFGLWALYLLVKVGFSAAF